MNFQTTVRPARSLETKWNKTNKDCALFVSWYKQVMRLFSSATVVWIVAQLGLVHADQGRQRVWYFGGRSHRKGNTSRQGTRKGQQTVRISSSSSFSSLGMF